MSVGIAAIGIYLPSVVETAQQIAAGSAGHWSEEAVINKLGIKQKYLPGPNDGTQMMGVMAALDCLREGAIDPMSIDLILCMGEEWKEYPLTTSGIYIQEQIGAKKAWAIDLQQRCCSTVAAMKIAKDMMNSDHSIKTTLIVGGYRNGDFVDYQDKSMSMMYNLSAGAGAILLQKDLGRNELLGSHIFSDGSMAHDAGVVYGGCTNPINQDNLPKAYHSLTLMGERHMKDRLNEVSMDNWFNCIDQALTKSNLTRESIDYLAILHIKRSMHHFILDHLHLKEEQSTYLEEYGHLGQVDQILSLKLGVEVGKIKDGQIVSMIAAGIGYAWAANVIRWGEVR
ncbi:MAG: 3-oxoacyl-ACP synthase [Bdellovibrionales bacterium]|jgi:3-oxoacyl-[acyl-carrier-protein] synthase III|nr:3-oxoacyl-ACP synthase [Bdellovibrionales bacterium]MBT7670600.1 3-oxoacyl-ACP synthase [Bdellovibrionales bacterium]